VHLGGGPGTAVHGTVLWHVLLGTRMCSRWQVVCGRAYLVPLWLTVEGGSAGVTAELMSYYPLSCRQHCLHC
jgi:hypothetical protein